MKVSPFKSSENTQKKEGGSDCTVSNDKFSSLTQNKSAMEAKEIILEFRFSTRQLSNIVRHYRAIKHYN